MIKKYKMFKVFVIVFILVSMVTAPAYAGGIFDAQYLNLEEYRGIGETILNVTVIGTTEGNVWGTGIYSDDSDIGVAAVHAGILKVGETKTVRITILPGQSSYVGTVQNGIESYDYAEWGGSFKFNDSQPSSTPSAPALPVNAGNTSSEVFKEGVIMSWQANEVLGYRLFKSKSENELGISVTDFYIKGTSYADVNVEPNTTYYYTVKTVLAEADPINGKEEVLGDIIARYTLKTGSEITKSENKKNFIVLQIDNPNMSVNGKIQEIDPGRGTTPIVISSRSMVPIRAIVEAMGGTVGWDNGTEQITLTANGNTVNMWVGKKEITVNGVKREIDVAPLIQNGRTYVPIRFSAENLNAKVDWINSTKEAVITYDANFNNNASNTQKPVPIENTQKPVPKESQPIVSSPEPETPAPTGNAEVPEITDSEGSTTEQKPAINSGINYSTPNQPVFYMEDRFEKLKGNEGKVIFRLNRLTTLGEYTGFKVYFTENGKSEVYEFGEDAFAYTAEIGDTVDIGITTVNGTAESTPQNLTFTMLDRIVGEIIWSERQTDDLLGSPCWYGLTWKPVEGAVKYSIFVSKDVRSYLNFVNYRDLSGFSSITVSSTSFSTKSSIGLPADIAAANWGEDRYVVVLPVNEDGITGPFPKYYKITMTGVSSPAY